MSKRNNIISYVRVVAFCFLMIGMNVCVYSQTSNETTKHINSLAQKMFVDINNRDYDAIIEMMHPKAFELVPKESFKSVFKSMFEGDEEFSIDIPKRIPEYKVSEVFKGDQNNLEYAFVSYDMNMKMTFHNQEFDEESKKMMIGMMKVQGMDVEFISSNTLDVLMNDRITILMKDDATNSNWVMINYDANSPLFVQIVPSDLIGAAKEYQQALMLKSKKESENK